MKKTLSAILAAVVIACGTTVFAGDDYIMMPQAVADYTDVPRDDSELSKAVYDLSRYRVICGYEDGTFRPDAAISRAELAKVVWLVLVGGTDRVQEVPTIYTDVPEDHWAAVEISYLTTEGVWCGRGDGTFGPEDAVSYEETVKTMVTMLGYGVSDIDNYSYPDDWLLKAEELGLTDGSKEDTTQYVTRAEVAVMLERLIDIPIASWDGHYKPAGSYNLQTGSGTDVFRDDLEWWANYYNELPGIWEKYGEQE